MTSQILDWLKQHQEELNSFNTGEERILVYCRYLKKLPSYQDSTESFSSSEESTESFSNSEDSTESFSNSEDSTESFSSSEDNTYV